jgi:hypothetical protein
MKQTAFAGESVETTQKIANAQHGGGVKFIVSEFF